MEPAPPMPPPTMAPPCTKGPSLPAMTPAPMANTIPVNLAIRVLTVSRPLYRHHAHTLSRGCTGAAKRGGVVL